RRRIGRGARRVRPQAAAPGVENRRRRRPTGAEALQEALPRLPLLLRLPGLPGARRPGTSFHAAATGADRAWSQRAIPTGAGAVDDGPCRPSSGGEVLQRDSILGSAGEVP